MLVDRHPAESVRCEVGEVAAVEALRGFAVLLVILFHYVVIRPAHAADPFVAWVLATRPVEVVLFNGNLGVELFFLISGFLLVLPWALHEAQGRAAPSARDFYVRRVRRIVPAYYVQLVLLFVLFAPLLTSVPFLRENAALVAYNAAAHAAFLHYTTPLSSASLGINGALWTLTLEAQFYLLLPLLAPLVVRRPVTWCVLLVAVGAAWRWLAQHDLRALVDGLLALGAPWQVAESAVRHLLATQLPAFLGHFGAGMGLGVAWLKLRGRVSGAREQALWLAALASALALLYALYGFAGVDQVGREAATLLTLAAIAVAFFAVVEGSALAARVVTVRPLLAAGRLSYSAYLYHVPLLLLACRYLPLPGSWLALPGYLALLFAAAWVSHRFVEQPFMRARQRRAAPAAPLAPPIIAE